jgi:hypothetical protein
MQRHLVAKTNEAAINNQTRLIPQNSYGIPSNNRKEMPLIRVVSSSKVTRDLVTLTHQDA